MTSTNIDYVDTYFEYPTLTKIHGEPTYETLKTIKNELKSNACSVTSDLGGGANGHLGLVLTPAEYTAVSPTAYAHPVHPGNLNIAPGTAHHEATRLRAEHNKHIRLFRETVDVEKALIKQLVAALEPKYLEALRSPTTNAIMIPLHDVLTYLFTRYGKVTAESLTELEEKVKTLQYNVTEPIITIFNEIEELSRVADAANNPFSEMQKVQIGLKVIKNTNDFETAIEKWYGRPAVEHTWANFKTHFDEARTLLREIRGPTMQNTNFSQMNLLAETIRTDMLRSQEHLLQAIATEQAHDNPPIAPEANAANDETNRAIIELLRTLTQDVRDLRSRPANPNARRSNRIHYCWTHGMCNHKSNECRNKRDGHKDDATKTNKMGGSNRGCTTAT